MNSWICSIMSENPILEILTVFYPYQKAPVPQQTDAFRDSMHFLNIILRRKLLPVLPRYGRSDISRGRSYCPPDP